MMLWRALASAPSKRAGTGKAGADGVHGVMSAAVAPRASDGAVGDECAQGGITSGGWDCHGGDSGGEAWWWCVLVGVGVVETTWAWRLLCIPTLTMSPAWA